MTTDPKESYIIFYDLETTDLYPTGQILNFALVATDHNYEEVEELKGTIAITPTQLPNPYAILANRVDVIEHNKNPTYRTEREAMLDIAGFIEYYKERSRRPVIFVGYNTTRFDLFYLRTVMTRNGINPYIGSPNNKTRYDKDVLHVGQYVATQDPEFRKMFLKDDGKVSLRLEIVSKKLGLLEGKQAHESRADVDITIKLAKYYLEHYNIHLDEFQSYQVKEFEKTRTVVQKLHPNDDKHHHNQDENNAGPGQMVYFTGNDPARKGQSLWIDLEKWRNGKGKDAVSWYNMHTSTFFNGGKVNCDPAEVERAIASYPDLTLANFFPDKNCDVEAWIYMMDYATSNVFAELVGTEDPNWRAAILSEIKSRVPDQKQQKYFGQLYKRYILNTQKTHDETYDDMLKAYALYRYGGKMKVDRYDCTTTYQDGVHLPSFHITWNELLGEISKLKETKSDPEDLHLLNQLEKFYLDSKINKLAGAELSKIVRKKP
jgi:hypothetical protein